MNSNSIYKEDHRLVLQSNGREVSGLESSIYQQNRRNSVEVGVVPDDLTVDIKRNLFRLKSSKFIEEEPEVELSFLDRMVIPEDNKWYQLFNGIITIMTILQVVGYPYLACFRSQSVPAFIIMAHISECFFLVEFLSNFFVKLNVIDPEQNHSTFKAVALRYLKNKFILLFLPVLPLQLLDLPRER